MSFLPTDVRINFTAGDRGVYSLLGVVDYLAPNLQVLHTPNGTPITLGATQADFYPRRWSIDSVVTPAPIGAPDWSDTTARIEANGIQTNLNDVPTGTDAISQMQVFTDGVASDVSKAVGVAKNTVYMAAGVVIVILVLILLIKSR